MVVSTELADELERVRDLDRHRNPSRDVEAILGRALALFAAEVEKRKFAATEAPRPRRADKRADEPNKQARKTRHVPAGVRRQVDERDGGRCTFEDSDRVCAPSTGLRTGERRFLEFDHVEPWARGGEHSRENGAELCAAHNRRKAERELGEERARAHIERARETGQKRRDIESAMTRLGFSPAEARQRAGHALKETPPDAPIEELLRAALAAVPA